MINKATITNIFESPKWPWVERGCFFLLSVILLGVLYNDFLYQIFWRNYFLSNDVFTVETLNQPAGLLHYCGRFLNQFLFYPTPAAFAISVLLTLLQWCISLLFDKEHKASFVTFIPSFLLLLSLVTIRYNIYFNIEIGFFFASVLGSFITIGVYALSRYLSKSTWKLIAASLFAIICHSAFGIYTVLPLMMIASEEWRDGNKKALPLAILLFFTIPVITAKAIFYETYTHALLSPILDPFFKISSWSGIGIIITFTLLPLLPEKKKFNLAKVSSAVIVAAMIGFIGNCFTDKNTNFRSEMKMSRMCDQEDWNGILEAMPKQVTHIQNAYRVIALNHANRINTELFSVKMPFIKNESPIAYDMLVYYPDVFFHSSLLSLARHLNMEKWVTVGECNKGLDYFIILALMKDEDDLAKRYIDLMKQTFPLKERANKYESYLSNKNSFYMDHPLYSDIKQHEFKEDRNMSGHAHLTQSILKFKDVSVNNIERRLLAELYQKNINQFVSDMSRAKVIYKSFPRYFQEAFVIKAAQTRNNSFLQIIPIEKSVIETVQNFSTDMMRYGNNMEKAAEELFPKYGNTYTYYYTFNKDNFNESLVK